MKNFSLNASRCTIRDVAPLKPRNLNACHENIILVLRATRFPNASEFSYSFLPRPIKGRRKCEVLKKIITVEDVY